MKNNDRIDYGRIFAEWCKCDKSVPPEAEKLFAELAEEKGVQEAKRIFLTIANRLEHRRPRGSSYDPTHDQELLKLYDAENGRTGISPEKFAEPLFEERTNPDGSVVTDYKSGAILYKATAPNKFSLENPTAMASRIRELLKARDVALRDLRDLDVACGLDK